MKHILFNGQPLHTSADSLDALIQEQGIEAPFAAAINQQFVPQANYASCLLSDNDAIDIVSPMQGG